MLKLIPQERPELVNKGNIILKKFFHQNKKNNTALILKLQQKLQREDNSDHMALKKICINFAKFVEKEEKATEIEIHDLTHNLQKAILCLQRHRHRLLRKRSKRK